MEKAKTIRTNSDAIKHPLPLHPDVQKHILPIFNDLSSDELLSRCLGGHTQNANESFNATVWRLAPKHLHCGFKIVEIAAYLAAIIFNEGYSQILKVMQELELQIGKQAMDHASKVDERRIVRQERRSLSSTREARKVRKEERMEQNSFFEETEGLLYGDGIAD